MKRLRSISGLGLLVVLILSGCATSQTELPVLEDQSINNNKVKVIGVTSLGSEDLDAFDLLQQVKKISVITPEGSEMELDYTFWIDNIVNKLDQFRESQRLNHSYSYTLILRTNSGSPLLMQVGNESILIGDRTYTSDLMPQIMLDIRGAIGKQLLTDLHMDQLSVFMLDVANYPLELAEDEVDELRRLIESAAFIHEGTDVKYPLFPHYVIQILDGDKSVVHLDIIGNNIVSIPYGKDQAFYYNLSENLYSRFYKTLPPFDFLDENPKSLFNATALEILEEGQEPLVIGQDGIVSTIADSITDSFARILVDGNKLMTPESLEKELFILFFIDTDQKKEVKIYSNGYTYRDRYYQSPNIGDKIRKHINAHK